MPAAPIERLVELLGVAGALKLAERFGGQRLYMPERVKPEGALAQAIGFEAAQKLAFEWRRDAVDIPKCAALLRARRDRQIREDTKAMSVAAVAEKWDTTERNVYMILARPEPSADEGAAVVDAAQRTLFP